MFICRCTYNVYLQGEPTNVGCPSLSARRCLRCAVDAAAGMSGYVGGACIGGVKGPPLRCMKTVASCRMPRCPLLRPQGHGTAIRLLPSSFSSFFMDLCVGSPSIFVSVLCGMSANMDSRVTRTMAKDRCSSRDGPVVIEIVTSANDKTEL